jgi:hypothetical protein
MLVTAMRGMHSTGIAVTDYKKPKAKPRTWKVLGGPCFLMQNKAWVDIDKYTFQNGGAIFGHGRHATKGNITIKNAHPFHHEGITLVHNGTIHSGLEYGTEKDEVEVDSHALCIKMAKIGIAEALEAVGGAYAVILHRQEDGSIWFGKNTDRPLYMIQAPDRIYLMSERESLEFICKKNSIYTQPEIVVSDKLYRFDLNSFNLTMEKDISKKTVYFGGFGNNWAYEGYPEWRGGESCRDNKMQKNEEPNIVMDIKRKEKTTFLVESIEPIGPGEYMYLAEDEDGDVVEFKTNCNYPYLLNKIGTAEIAYEVIRKGERHKFVKFRNIEWTPENEIETMNGKKMSMEKWRVLIKTDRCGMCSDNILEEDYSKTIVHDNGAIVCKTCVSEHLNENKTSSVQAIQ